MTDFGKDERTTSDEERRVVDKIVRWIRINYNEQEGCGPTAVLVANEIAEYILKGTYNDRP